MIRYEWRMLSDLSTTHIHTHTHAHKCRYENKCVSIFKTASLKKKSAQNSRRKKEEDKFQRPTRLESS